jgi:hypothetical protein
MTKRLLIRSAYSNASACFDVLTELKSQDIKDRKKAKPSKKKLYTKRIYTVSSLLAHLKLVKTISRKLPKRA